MQFHLAERVASNQTVALFLGLALGVMLALALAALSVWTSLAIVIAGIAGIGATLLILSEIEYGLYALIGIATLLPFASIPINLGFNPTFLDIALVLLFMMWLARMLTRQDEAPFRITALGIPLLTFIVLALFSFVIGMAHAGLEIQIVRHFAEILLALALYFLVVNIVRTRERLERVVCALIVAGGVSAALGIVFYFLPSDAAIRILSLLRVFKYPTGDAVLRYIEDNPDNPLRAISTSIDPNVLGGLMILTAALTAPQIFSQRPLLPRPLTAAFWLAMFACLILTFSRGALLGLGAALVVIAFVKYRRFLPVMLIGAVIFYFAPFTQGYVQHLADAVMASDLATQMRLGEYKDAFILISRNPIFGVGFLGTPDIDTYLGVSSVYLLMAEEMGVIGVAVFLLTMVLYYWQAASAWLGGLSQDERLAPILLGITTALIGSMTAGLFDHYFFNLDFPHSVTLFWLFVGLGVATIELKRETASY
jgi:O-Antigen ligase